MADFIDWLFNGNDIGHMIFVIIIGLLGLIMYVKNWMKFIFKISPEGEGMHLSLPFGGLLIAAAILMTGGGWWALVGLTDAHAVYIFLYIFVYKPREKTLKNKENGDKKRKCRTR